MGKTLEAFALGNLQTRAQFFEKNSEYGQVLKRLCTVENALRPMLDNVGKQRLEQMINAQAELQSLEGIDRLVRGYKLGVLMTLEAFTDVDDLLGQTK